MDSNWPRIPYGVGDFGQLRRQHRLYVDKTRFVRLLEDRHFVFFIRPRRFGKSLWVSLLEYYYDRFHANRFGELFDGTDIGADPTPNRSRYVVLRLDFSAFGPARIDLQERFEEHCTSRLEDALERNSDLFSEPDRRRILASPTLNGKLDRMFAYAARNDVPVCVLIDEYDNFANTVLAHHGQTAYHEFTHGEGFFRSFFTTLKAGAGRGGIDRLFMTGVSPITLDDVTSGFNIADNISVDPTFSDMVGFTEAEVRHLLETYSNLGIFNQDLDAALDTMRTWYDGYRFGKRAPETVYNTDMVLYYLKESIPNRPTPDYLIDENVRVDYGKLRHLILVSRQRPKRLNGNFDILRNIVGEGRAVAEIRKSFPLERLAEPENFLSLLYYFGLLSVRGTHRNKAVLGIPNDTVRHLLYSYIRDAYRDVDLFSVDLYRLELLISDMAFAGAWRPLIKFLSTAIAEQTSIREYISGEKVLQGFMAAYFGLTHEFLMRSEAELGKGHADLVLEPFTARYPDMRYGYVIEPKYLTRGEDRADALADRRLAHAQAQLRRYLADPSLRARFPTVQFIGLALVFHGWELVRCEEVRHDLTPD